MARIITTTVAVCALAAGGAAPASAAADTDTGEVPCPPSCVQYTFARDVTLFRQWVGYQIATGAHATCVRAHESDPDGGFDGYQAQNPTSSASGAYGFLDSTWDNVAYARGRPDLAGIHARDAAPWEQDASFGYLAAVEGDAPWGSRCN